MQNTSNLVPSAMKFITAALLHRSDLRFEGLKEIPTNKSLLAFLQNQYPYALCIDLYLVFRMPRTPISMSFPSPHRHGHHCPVLFCKTSIDTAIVAIIIAIAMNSIALYLFSRLPCTAKGWWNTASPRFSLIGTGLNISSS